MAPKTKRRIPAGERAGIGFRVKPELKAKIEEAALFSGRSQSQEIELALERAFMSEGMWLVRGDARARVIYYNGDLLCIFGDEAKGDIAILSIRSPHLERFLTFFGMEGEE
jgi:hypothetical protein